MIVGAGRAGKTSLTRSMLGETPLEHMESTIGINEFSCTINNALLSEAGTNSWEKYDEKLKMFESTTVTKQFKQAQQTQHMADGPSRKQETSQLLKDQFNERKANPSEQTFNDGISERAVTNELGKFDNCDFDVKVSHEILDKEEVAKCLAENVAFYNSKFIISILDYEGQSIFDVIHPFFLTKYGIYIVTFDMSLLVGRER